MNNSNLKIQKKREYNQLSSKVIKREAVGIVKCFIKEVRPNPKDVFGTRKADGLWYNMNGRNVSRSYPRAEQYDQTKIYFYEVGANDGSYRKCASKEAAEKAFTLLAEFEKRQMQVK